LSVERVDVTGSPFTQTTEQLFAPGALRISRKSKDPVLSDALVATITFVLLKQKTGIEFSPESSIHSALTNNNILNNAYGASINAGTATTATTKDVPSVSITSPKNKVILQAGSTEVLYANASDKSGILAVEFFINSSSVCKKMAYPYTCEWKVPQTPSSVYAIEAKATNKLGKSASTRIFVYTN
jgi:hypothetical protein